MKGYSASVVLSLRERMSSRGARRLHKSAGGLGWSFSGDRFLGALSSGGRLRLFDHFVGWRGRRGPGRDDAIDFLAQVGNRDGDLLDRRIIGRRRFGDLDDHGAQVGEPLLELVGAARGDSLKAI